MLSVLLALATTVAFALPIDEPTKTLNWPQCAPSLAAASSILSLVGPPNSIGWDEHWTDVNLLEDTYAYQLTTGSQRYSAYMDDSEYNPSTFPLDVDQFFQGSNDDALWAALSYMKYHDWLVATGRGWTREAARTMDLIHAIYDFVSKSWTDLCGGGILWAAGGDYKNAVTNELYISVSGAGYLRWRNETWLANSKKTWDWLYHSGMRNSAGLYNDGLNAQTCQNNGQTTWTYNQGVILSGLGLLYANTGSRNVTYLKQAEITADAIMRPENGLIANGILKEGCDSTTAFSCNNDQRIFKGIYTKHLAYYLDHAPPTSALKYRAFLTAQAHGVAKNARQASGGYSPVWYAPNTIAADSRSDASAVEAYLAAGKYGSCYFP